MVVSVAAGRALNRGCGGATAAVAVVAAAMAMVVKGARKWSRGQ